MDNFEKFYNIALRFLSYRPRSEKEVRDYLVRRHCGEEDRWNGRDSGHGQNDETESIVERVIAKLKEQRFINDEEFARWWIEQRSTFRAKSIRFIKMELKQKGIDRNIIDRIIHNSPVGGQAEFIIQNDLEQAKKLVEKRIERFRNLSKQEIYQKLGGFLARRGFDWETIKQSIDEFISKEYTTK